jgi:hypothetical protein
MKYTRNVPGVVGEIIKWTTATAPRRPNPIVGLATAITVVGTLIGRRAATPTRSGTHSYTILIGKTGAGKQHGHDCATELMHAAGATAHLAPGEYFSLSGLYRMLHRHPLSLCLQDEIGAFLKALTSTKASSWEASANRFLHTAWGAAFKMLPGVQWAQTECGPVWGPALTIYGLSTPTEFVESVQGASVGNGFVNRMLMLDMGPRTKPRDPPNMAPGPPSTLASALKELHIWTGPESLARIDDPNARYQPDVLPWADRSAYECFREFERLMERQSDKRAELGDFYSRCPEMATRLATIRAAGRWGHRGGVDASDMEWGAGITGTAANALATSILGHMPENERSRRVSSIFNWIKDQYGEHGRPVTKREVQIQMGGRVKATELKDMIDDLVVTGRVRQEGNGYVPEG